VPEPPPPVTAVEAVPEPKRRLGLFRRK
jgi:hypothetical protein